MTDLEAGRRTRDLDDQFQGGVLCLCITVP